MRNIEIKTRLHAWSQAESVLRGLGAVDAGSEIQLDTFYRAERGRLKLRESSRDGATLIHYERADADAPRVSEYTLVPVADPVALRRVLDRAIGPSSQVRKERRLYRIDNVRVHLDQVEGLGDFLELEAVVDAGHPEDVCHRRCEELLECLGITPEARLAVAYVDLVAAR